LPVRTESRNLKPVPQSAPHAASHRIGITQATYSPSQPVETEQQIKQVSAAEAESSESSAPAFLDLDNSEATQAGTEAAPQTDMDMILRLATWTIIILCLCVLTVLGLRSWQKKHGMLPVTQGNSRVLETVSIGPNRSVCLVQLRDIQAVVGCDASGIQSIVLAPPSFDTALAETDEPAEVFETTI
jgi:flagellar biogenesis protein FliO